MQTIDLEKLTSDGDTIELPNGKQLRLIISSDPDTSINDFDCYGKIEWVHGERSTTQRPEHFTGNAEKLDNGWYDQLWWEPPTDIYRNAAEFSKLRAAVVDLVEYGFYYVKLELLNGQDAYGRAIVEDFAVIGGVDSYAPEDINYLIQDLASELDMS